MLKEFWFEDGYHAIGEFTESQVRTLKNDHGLIVEQRNWTAKRY